jgi:hypothetical protein
VAAANPEADFEEQDEDAIVDQTVEVDRITRLALEHEEHASTPVRHSVFSVQTTNTSPGGYCIEWNDPPDGLQIGDLVCVREAQLESADWTIAVVRWISQVKNAPTLLGLELISPRGSAYAAQIKMPDGERSKPIRVLVLPEIPLVGQSHTMLVPRLVFKEGQRIHLKREEDAFLVKLKRQVSSTGYFSQMDFDYLRPWMMNRKSTGAKSCRPPRSTLSGLISSQLFLRDAFSGHFCRTLLQGKHYAGCADRPRIPSKALRSACIMAKGACSRTRGLA